MLKAEQSSSASAAPANRSASEPGPGYRWIALSNTTLGVFMAFVNTNVVMIAMPAIFQGIGVDPLSPNQTNYFLWLLLGYLVVTSTLLVSFGRLSDLFGRVRLYNLGFAIFTLGSVLLAVTPGSGDAAALQLILYRLIQGVGAGFLFANSSAILTDAFPEHQRGLAMGLNQVAGIIGSVLGLIVGGLLAVINWRLVFVFSIPVGLFGTVWGYWKLRETAKPPQRHPIDWAGNLAFAAGLTLLLIGVTYGIQPYGGSPMGWTSPWVLGACGLGTALLALFVWIELRVRAPMFRLELFRIRLFAAGNAAGFLAALARGGLTFMLIIWLQGVWLPLHGYRFEETPLWAAIYMTPLLGGIVVAGPVCGWLTDRIGSRLLTTVGMILNIAGFIGLTFLPADFDYFWFAALLVVLGVGQGMFAAPNTTAIMNSVPAEHRGVASGMRATFQNTATLASIGLFFSIVIAALSTTLPPALAAGLTRDGLPAESAERIAHVPPTAALFAAFLGYNPMGTLVPEAERDRLSPEAQRHLLGKTFFPHMIARPFMIGLRLAFYVSAGLCLIAAAASLLRGGPAGRDSTSERGA